MALVATAVAPFFQDRADDRATAAREAGVVSDANRLAALSKSARALDASLLLAAAAVRTEDTPATRESLLSALVEHRRATAVHQLALHGVQETALSANGRTLMATVGGGEPQVLVWRPGRTGTPEVTRSAREPPRGPTDWGSAGASARRRSGSPRPRRRVRPVAGPTSGGPRRRRALLAFRGSTMAGIETGAQIQWRLRRSWRDWARRRFRSRRSALPEGVRDAPSVPGGVGESAPRLVRMVRTMTATTSRIASPAKIRVMNMCRSA